MRKLYSPVGIVFKGSGFYSTDTKKKGDSKTAASSGKTDEKKPAKSEKPEKSTTTDKK